MIILLADEWRNMLMNNPQDNSQTAGSQTSKSLSRRHKFHIPLVAYGILTGAISGVVSCFYRFAIEESSTLAINIYGYLVQRWYLIPLWFMILAALAFAVGKLVRIEPLIKGSGIPQTEAVLLRQIDMKWWRVLLTKFTGGVLCMFAGLALGREGPSIQLGGAVGQGIRKLFRRPEAEEKYLITGGASAGLAAAFNAPLAGVVFALEEVHRHFSPAVLLTAMSAAVTADLVSKLLYGGNPVLEFRQIPQMPLDMTVWLIVLGLAAGAGGVLFNYTIAKAQDAYGKIPEKYRLLAPFLLAGVVGLLLPVALGGGHGLILSSSTGNLGMGILVILLVVRFLFTMASFGSGAPGGIFLPLLTLGALLGSLFGQGAASVLHISSDYLPTFVALAMAGYFTAVVRAPVTGILLITEMTGSFSHLLSLSIVVATAYLTAELLRSKPVYDALLERLLSGKLQHTRAEPGKAIVEVVVFADSSLDGKQVKLVQWPEKSLVVSIRRGSNEIIPNGETTMLSGDMLAVLTDMANAGQTKKDLLYLASNSSL